MGSWKCLSVTPSILDRNDVFGHFFAVEFKLQYTPSTFGMFAEMPRLEWKETITMVEQRAGTWWQYIGDQFARNPGSMTFMSWTSRYIWAYHNVCGGKYDAKDIDCLYDKLGNPLPDNTFPELSEPKAQADAVRSYLKNQGGIMRVTVVDKPGINKPMANPTVLKDRVLTFDCGLKGLGPRVNAVQHLIVDGAASEATWHRECRVGGVAPPLQTAGLNRVSPPADVSIVKPFTDDANSGMYL